MSDCNTPRIKPAMYTVGVGDDGQTQLTLNNDYGSITLSMNAASVEQMIALLEATL